MNIHYICAGALAVLLGWPVGALAACHAGSGPVRYSLLELYTSEGCSSCPPADRWLSELRPAAAARRLVPLAFHVDYWNGLGWVDRYARPEYAERQRWLAGLRASRTVYTPQFVLDGRAGRPGWLASGGAGRAGAEIDLDLAPARSGGIEVTGRVRLADRTGTPRLYLAVYENGLSSRVEAGENAGRSLRHDYVVRELAGPFDLAPAGETAFRRRFAVDPDWRAANLGVAAFVQDAATGEVYQALAQTNCLGTR